MNMSLIEKLIAVLLATVAGAVLSASCVLAAVTPSSYDDNFGTAGVAIRARAASDRGAAAVAIAEQPDGRIVVAAWCLPNTANIPKLCVYRLLANGSSDPSFAGGGVFTTDLDIEWYSNAWVLAQVAVQRTGKIVLATTCRGIDDAVEFCLLRLNVDGSVDGTFAGGGIPHIGIGVGSGLNAMALDTIDRIVLAGTCGNPSDNTTYICLARYTEHGGLDTGFGSAGVAQIQPAGATNAMGLALAINSSGRIIVAGRCSSVASGESFCIVQLNAAGVLQSGFGTSGVVSVAPGSGVISRAARAIVIQADGRIVVGGSCGPTFCLVRLRADGVLDTTFDGGYGATGISVLAFPGVSSAYLSAMAAQGDGRLVAVGTCSTPSSSQQTGCIARLWPDGYADSSFGVGGYEVYTDAMLVGGPGRLSDVAVTADGGLLMPGVCWLNGEQNPDHGCVLRVVGGPNTFSRCSFDIDGDGVVLPRTDGVLWLRAMLGLRVTQLIAGISFPAAARRSTAAAIRDYLSQQCGVAVRVD